MINIPELQQFRALDMKEMMDSRWSRSHWYNTKVVGDAMSNILKISLNTDFDKKPGPDLYYDLYQCGLDVTNRWLVMMAMQDWYRWEKPGSPESAIEKQASIEDPFSKKFLTPDRRRGVSFCIQPGHTDKKQFVRISSIRVPSHKSNYLPGTIFTGFNMRIPIHAVHPDTGEAEIIGWVHEVRDLGGLTFLLIRDRTGIIQVTIPKKKASESVLAAVKAVSRESVVRVSGPVKPIEKAPGGRELVPNHSR